MTKEGMVVVYTYFVQVKLQIDNQKQTLFFNSRENLNLYSNSNFLVEYAIENKRFLCDFINFYYNRFIQINLEEI